MEFKITDTHHEMSSRNLEKCGKDISIPEAIIEFDIYPRFVKESYITFSGEVKDGSHYDLFIDIESLKELMYLQSMVNDPLLISEKEIMIYGGYIE